MSRTRKKILKYSDRFNIYISELVDEEILDFLNKQSDLTATVMAGIIKLYQENGNIDLVNYLPRTYSTNSIIPALLVEDNNHNIRVAPTQTQQNEVQQTPQVIPQQEDSRTAQPTKNQGTGDQQQVHPPTVVKEPSQADNNKPETPKQSSFLNNASVGNMANFAAIMNQKKD